MSISSIAASSVLKPPEPSPPKQPDVKAEESRTAQPTILAALPPGQGTRINQLA
jgi:hypothetical protein